MCLMQGLINMKDEANVLDTNSIALYYKKWVDSEPFDIGETTSTALEPLLEGNVDAKRAKDAAKEYNTNS